MSSTEKSPTVGSGKWLTVLPAYGRDYRTAEEVLNDWNADKDFRISDISCPFDGKYVNRRDANNYPELRTTTFKVRYGTILGTGWQWPNFCLIRHDDQGNWVITGKSDMEDHEEIPDEEEPNLSDIDALRED